MRQVLTAVLAVLIAVVSVAHAGAHLPTASPEGLVLVSDPGDTGAGCALCQNAGAVSLASSLPTFAGEVVSPVPALRSALVSAPEAGGVSSRGPPALG